MISVYNTIPQLKKYKIDQLLGKGCFGQVRKAYNYQTKEWIALKFIQKKFKKRNDLKKQKHQFDILKKLSQYQYIITAYNYIQSKEWIIIQTQLADSDLSCYLKREKYGRISNQQEIKRISMQIILALKEMHLNKIVHRDLKPQNILLKYIKNERQKEEVDVRLCDFGFAKELKSKDFFTSMKGTPLYIAPQMLSIDPDGQQIKFTPKVDIWAFGIILFQMATGKPPFYQQQIHLLFPKIRRQQFRCPNYISQELKNLIEWILKSPLEKRPSLQEIQNHQFYKDFLLKANLVIAKKLKNNNNCQNNKKKSKQKTNKDLNDKKSSLSNSKSNKSKQNKKSQKKKKDQEKLILVLRNPQKQTFEKRNFSPQINLKQLYEKGQTQKIQRNLYQNNQNNIYYNKMGQTRKFLTRNQNSNSREYHSKQRFIKSPSPAALENDNFSKIRDYQRNPIRQQKRHYYSPSPPSVPVPLLFRANSNHKKFIIENFYYNQQYNEYDNMKTKQIINPYPQKRNSYFQNNNQTIKKRSKQKSKQFSRQRINQNFYYNSDTKNQRKRSSIKNYDYFQNSPKDFVGMISNFRNIQFSPRKRLSEYQNQEKQFSQKQQQQQMIISLQPQSLLQTLPQPFSQTIFSIDQICDKFSSIQTLQKIQKLYSQNYIELQQLTKNQKFYLCIRQILAYGSYKIKNINQKMLFFIFEILNKVYEDNKEYNNNRKQNNNRNYVFLHQKIEQKNKLRQKQYIQNYFDLNIELLGDLISFIESIKIQQQSCQYENINNQIVLLQKGYQCIINGLSLFFQRQIQQFNNKMLYIIDLIQSIIKILSDQNFYYHLLNSTINQKQYKSSLLFGYSLTLLLKIILFRNNISNKSIQNHYQIQIFKILYHYQIFKKISLIFVSFQIQKSSQNLKILKILNYLLINSQSKYRKQYFELLNQLQIINQNKSPLQIYSKISQENYLLLFQLLNSYLIIIYNIIKYSQKSLKTYLKVYQKRNYFKQILYLLYNNKDNQKQKQKIIILILALNYLLIKYQQKSIIQFDQKKLLSNEKNPLIQMFSPGIKYFELSQKYKLFFNVTNINKNKNMNMNIKVNVNDELLIDKYKNYLFQIKKILEILQQDYLLIKQNENKKQRQLSSQTQQCIHNQKMFKKIQKLNYYQNTYNNIEQKYKEIKILTSSKLQISSIIGYYDILLQLLCKIVQDAFLLLLSFQINTNGQIKNNNNNNIIEKHIIQIILYGFQIIINNFKIIIKQQIKIDIHININIDIENNNKKYTLINQKTIIQIIKIFQIVIDKLSSSSFCFSLYYNQFSKLIKEFIIIILSLYKQEISNMNVQTIIGNTTNTNTNSNTNNNRRQIQIQRQNSNQNKGDNYNHQKLLIISKILNLFLKLSKNLKNQYENRQITNQIILMSQINIKKLIIIINSLKINLSSQTQNIILCNYIKTILQFFNKFILIKINKPSLCLIILKEVCHFCKQNQTILFLYLFLSQKKTIKQILIIQEQILMIFSFFAKEENQEYYQLIQKSKIVYNLKNIIEKCLKQLVYYNYSLQKQRQIQIKTEYENDEEKDRIYQSILQKTLNLVGNLSRHSTYFFQIFYQQRIIQNIIKCLKRYFGVNTQYHRKINQKSKHNQNQKKTIKRNLLYAIGNLSFYNDMFHEEIAEGIPQLLTNISIKKYSSLSTFSQNNKMDTHIINNTIATFANLIRKNPKFMNKIIQYNVIQEIFENLSQICYEKNNKNVNGNSQIQSTLLKFFEKVLIRCEEMKMAAKSAALYYLYMDNMDLWKRVQQYIQDIKNQKREGKINQQQYQYNNQNLNLNLNQQKQQRFKQFYPGKLKRQETQIKNLIKKQSERKRSKQRQRQNFSYQKRNTTNRINF